MEWVKAYLKNSLIFKRFKATPLYRKHIYVFLFKRVWKKTLYKEAAEKFEVGKYTFGSLKDYKKALDINLVSYSEYMYQYEFYKLSNEERNEYVSRLEMRLWYERNANSILIENLFYNKSNWLNHFKEYIHRKWIALQDVSYSTFMNFLEAEKLYIVKPNEGSLGEGIYKIAGTDFTEVLFETLKKNNSIVEELVVNEPSIAAFHPASLNTIRITSLRSGEIIGSFIRFGNNGNIVDNAHAGGIFAQIDIHNGKISTDGIDTDGNTYAVHPFSHKKIKGFEIPKWTEIKNLIRLLHDKVPEAWIVGWDICINQNNEVEIIEGNHLPDVDLLQSPQKQGLRRKINKLLQEANLPRLNRL